jgi:putative SOS response-associated peptidase YedK
MPGRLIASVPLGIIAAATGAMLPPSAIAPRYNLAPQGLASVVHLARTPGPKPRPRIIAPATFGIKVPEPAWKAAKARRQAGQRREEVVPSARLADLQKPAWRELLQHRRSVVVVEGYWDWISPYPSLPKQRHAYAVRTADGHPMMLACLCDEYGADREGAEQRFAVITVPTKDANAAPNGWMPAILRPEDVAAWLGDDGVKRDAGELLTLLRPTPAGSLNRYRVADAVNDPANDGEDLLWPSQMAA